MATSLFLTKISQAFDKMIRLKHEVGLHCTTSQLQLNFQRAHRQAAPLADGCQAALVLAVVNPAAPRRLIT